MPTTTTHRPGTFCWWELATPDPDKAFAYYEKLLHWGKQDMPVGDGTTYRMAELGGAHVCGIYKPDPSASVPPSWLCYVAVESADETAKRIVAAGGKVLQAPFDVMDVGRMAVFQDPTGATAAVWQARRHPGAGIFGDIGAACWSELATRDSDRAKDFYGRVFDWKPVEKSGPMPYTEFHLEGEEMATGGMYKITPDMSGMSPAWTVYFRVEDCDETVRKSEKAGGKTLVPPTDIPGIGRFALLEDPTGAIFNVIKLSM